MKKLLFYQPHFNILHLLISMQVSYQNFQFHFSSFRRGGAGDNQKTQTYFASGADNFVYTVIFVISESIIFEFKAFASLMYYQGN